MVCRKIVYNFELYTGIAERRIKSGYFRPVYKFFGILGCMY